MLVLTRKQQQRIQIGDNVTITILRVKGQTVRVGIEAPEEIRVLRGELPAANDVVGDVPAPPAPVASDAAADADADEPSASASLKADWSAPLASWIQRGGAASAAADVSIMRL